MRRFNAKFEQTNVPKWLTSLLAMRADRGAYDAPVLWRRGQHLPSGFPLARSYSNISAGSLPGTAAPRVTRSDGLQENDGTATEAIDLDGSFGKHLCLDSLFKHCREVGLSSSGLSPKLLVSSGSLKNVQEGTVACAQPHLCIHRLALDLLRVYTLRRPGYERCLLCDPSRVKHPFEREREREKGGGRGKERERKVQQSS